MPIVLLIKKKTKLGDFIVRSTLLVPTKPSPIPKYTQQPYDPKQTSNYQKKRQQAIAGRASTKSATTTVPKRHVHIPTIDIYQVLTRQYFFFFLITRTFGPFDPSTILSFSKRHVLVPMMAYTVRSTSNPGFPPAFLFLSNYLYPRTSHLALLDLSVLGSLDCIFFFCTTLYISRAIPYMQFRSRSLSPLSI